MAGQVAYHLMAQAGTARAPWAITTVVSCLPVLVLGMGTALAHMLRADAEAVDRPDDGVGQPGRLRPLSWSSEDQAGPGRRRPEADRDRSAKRDQAGPGPGPAGQGDPARPGSSSHPAPGTGPPSRPTGRAAGPGPASWPACSTARPR
jgi:hypothetical protein